MAHEPHKTLHSPARGEGPETAPEMMHDDAPPRRDGPDRRTLAMAAVLLTEDGWKDVEIADHLGISRRTLARWKTRQDMRLALEMGYLLQIRRFHRRRRWWPHDIGPRTPDVWEGQTRCPDAACNALTPGKRRDGTPDDSQGCPGLVCSAR